MRLSIFCLLLLFSFGRQASIEDQVKDLIDQLKEAIPEPISVPKLDVELTNKYLPGYLDLTDFILKGLKNLDVSITFVFSTIPTDFTLTIDSIDLNTGYLCDLALLNSSLLHIFGGGTASVLLTNFTIKAKMSLSILPKNLTISELETHLNDGQFEIDGLLYDDEISSTLNDFLNTNVVTFINENSLSSTIEGILNNAISSIISGNSTSSEAYDEINSNYLAEDYEATNYNSEVQEIFEELLEFFNSLKPEAD